MDVAPARSRAERLGWSALAFPSFRTFFGATLVSNTAAFILSAGINWAALETSGSAAGVAGVGFLFALPFTLLTLHAGLLADWFGGKRMLALSLALTGAAVAGLGILALLAGLPWAAIAVAAVVIGTLSVLGSPAGMTIAQDLVPPGLLPSAMTLIWITVNFGRIAGGLVAGVTLALYPGGVTLCIAGLMSVGTALAIARLPVAPPARTPIARGALVAPLLEAAGHAFRDPAIALLIALTAVMGTLGLAFNYQLPVAATELGGGANGFGALVAAVGAGGLLAGSVAERLMRRIGQGGVIVLGAAGVVVGLILCGLSPTLPLAILSMGIAGAGFAIYGATTLALIQALGAPAVRGRLTALFSLLYWGLMPLGAILGGIVASNVGALTTLLLFGLGILVALVIVLLLRPELVRMRVDADGRVVGRPAPAG